MRRHGCCACGKPPRSQAHHLSGQGKGRKARDDETMPLCRECHLEHFDNFTGPFAGMDKRSRRDWQLQQIETMRRRYRVYTSLHQKLRDDCF